MLWLQSPPWAKWIAVGLIAAIALWIELRPDPMVEHPFASVDISPGETIGPHNTESRQLPAGLLQLPDEGDVALRPIPTGSPVLGSATGSPDTVVPSGWWTIAMDMPAGTSVGQRVLVVLHDSGETVDGVVTSVATDDPFTSGNGGVAVRPEVSAEVAKAAANARVSVLVSTG